MNSQCGSPAQGRRAPVTAQTPETGPYGRVYDRLYRLGYHRKSDYSHAKVLSAAAQRRWQPKDVLDVGCSLGWTLEYFGSHGARAVGVDISQVAVRRCRALGRDARVASAACLPFNDREFDLVISTDCLEHLTPADAPRAVREMARVSRRAIGVKVNPRPDRNRWWRFLAAGPLHLTCVPVETWLGWFAAEGFSLVDSDDAREEYLLERG